jgi:hypothetical protein
MMLRLTLLRSCGYDWCDYQMKTYKISERELNERLKLDKRRNNQAFCICFKSLEEAPKDFFELQDRIRDGLQREFWLNFDNGAEHLRRKPWDSKNFFFNTDMFGSERIVVEMSKEILDDKMIGLTLSYLEKNALSYCLTASVFENMEKGSDYFGRFVINLNEIAVEESLVDVWSKQMRFMEIELDNPSRQP